MWQCNSQSVVDHSLVWSTAWLSIEHSYIADSLSLSAGSRAGLSPSGSATTSQTLIIHLFGQLPDCTLRTHALLTLSVSLQAVEQGCLHLQVNSQSAVDHLLA